MTDPREARLPRWAQRELQSLRIKLQSTSTALAKAHGLVPGAVAVRDPHHDAVPVAWPTDTIRFFMAGSEYPYVDVRLYERGVLDVRSSEAIAVIPQASNVVRVQVARL